jgi:MATE family multidrug resistance protein
MANVTGISIMYGMGSVLETIGSQLNGARRYKEVGHALQRSCLILAAVGLAVVPLWLYAGAFCRYSDIDAVTCDTTEVFLRIRLVSLPGVVLHICYEFYLMAVGVFLPSMYSGIAYNLLLLVFNHLFINVLGLGYQYLAHSLVLSMYLSVLLQVGVSIRHPNVQRTMQRPSWEALKQWGEFVSLGVSATIMLCAEWWAYEILALMAARLGSDSLSAESILVQTEYLAFVVPLCLGYAITSLVGNSIGAGDVALSRLIAKHAMYIILVVEICVGLCVYFLSPPWIAFLIQDENVQRIAHKAVPLLSYYAFMDCFQGIASGVLKGAGKQVIGALVNLVAFYALALPMAYVFCFVFRLGVNGLLMGFCFGTTFQTIFLWYLLTFREDYVYSSSNMSIQTLICGQCAAPSYQILPDIET